MAEELQNLFQSAAALAVNGSTQASDAMYHSGNISTSPAPDRQHTGLIISASFTFSAAPSVGDMVELAYARSDGTQVDGDLPAAASVLTGTALQRALDSLHSAPKKRLVASGTATGPYILSLVIPDPSPIWQYSLYTKTASVSLAASPVVTGRYYDPQRQVA